MCGVGVIPTFVEKQDNLQAQRSGKGPGMAGRR